MRSILVLSLLLPLSGLAQRAPVPPKLSSKPTKRATPPVKLNAQQQFVVDVVRSAVARDIQDPQDRLRVLATAVNVVRPVRPQLARQYATEGAKIEGQLIASGETPVVSIMETGDVSCATATQFVDDLPTQRIVQAEQSLIGAVNVCQQAFQGVQAKLDAGAPQKLFPARATMAAAERAGLKSQWAQSRFERMIDNLPDPKQGKAEAPNIAAMYDRMAHASTADVAKKTGITLLDWLSKLEDSPERNLSIRITSDAMKKALGNEKYEEALRSDIIAQQAVRIKGNMEVPRPQEESVSVVSALNNRGTDQTEQIRSQPPIMRAKQAAASGFAEGTHGSKTQASKYFDIAFSALDEAWQQQKQSKSVSSTVEEVASAAAHVDYVDALKRSEHLSVPAEQAIGMLAVARSVLGRSL